jgi:hypothetical protein
MPKVSRIFATPWDRLDQLNNVSIGRSAEYSSLFTGESTVLVGPIPFLERDNAERRMAFTAMHTRLAAQSWRFLQDILANEIADNVDVVLRQITQSDGCAVLVVDRDSLNFLVN